MATSFRVPDEMHREPVDSVLRRTQNVSWGKARTWLERGKVRVDGAIVTEATKRVAKGAEVVIDERAPNPKKASNVLAMDDAIVHMDAHVIVVRKPSGVSSVPFDERERGTLDELVRAYVSKRERGGARPNIGVVHRLDKETTGLIVFTRTWLAKQSLSNQFRFHTVQRKYIAIVHGDPGDRTIRSHIIADRGDGVRGSLEMMTRKIHGEGQLAVTHVRVVERLEGASVVECTLETGRTHQIRIHLSEAGSPVLGDRVYIRGYKGPQMPAPRVMLHAAELGFVHPKTEVPIHFTDPIPADMAERLATLR